jgi:hypothetical protein
MAHPTLLRALLDGISPAVQRAPVRSSILESLAEFAPALSDSGILLAYAREQAGAAEKAGERSA